jgi:hypothetical protein
VSNTGSNEAVKVHTFMLIALMIVVGLAGCVSYKKWS